MKSLPDFGPLMFKRIPEFCRWCDGPIVHLHDDPSQAFGCIECDMMPKWANVRNG